MSSGDATVNPVKHLIRSHNEQTLASLVKGDLVKIPRGLYSHWAVYIGNEQIIHLAGEYHDGMDASIRTHHMFTLTGQRYQKCKVCRASYWYVVCDDKAYNGNDKDHKWPPLSGRDIVRNARQCMGNVGYSVIYENCEHFAKWCRYGKAKSDQIDNVVIGLGVAVAGVLLMGLLHATTTYFKGEASEDRRRQQLWFTIFWIVVAYLALKKALQTYTHENGNYSFFERKKIKRK